MPSDPHILVYHEMEAKKYENMLRTIGYTNFSIASTSEQAIDALPLAEIVLGWQLPVDLIHTYGKKVKWIQAAGAGVNDLTIHNQLNQNIIITRIIDQFNTSIAEYIFSYLLYITKDLNRLLSSQKKRVWDPFILPNLNGKTIGVAGLGSIGCEVVRKARAFDMRVFGLSATGRNAAIVDQHFSMKDWIPFVRELDFLVLTLPLTEQTHHVVHHDVFLAMKKGSGLINVGRGALINEEHLVDVLQKKHLGSVVLDVFEHEPLRQDHPFWDMPEVYITPHISGPSLPEEIFVFFHDNLMRYISGQTLEGVVNRESGY